MGEVLIVGAGPAGLTAALYALRYGYRATVFEGEQHGGQVSTTFEVENYPAIQRITGYELAAKLYGQAVEAGAVMVAERVIAIDTGEEKTVFTQAGAYTGGAVIIAGGAKRRKLGCPGEERLGGHGVSYCAACDGNFFRNKEVAVIGGGSTALEDALFLANICKTVYMIHRRDRFSGLSVLIRGAAARPNIRVLFGTRVTEIQGGAQVERLLLEREGTPGSLGVDGVFIAIGTEPDNGYLSGGIELDEQGYIRADETCTTNAEGIFAAGDCRTKALRQIVTAAADGAVAAFMAASYLSRL